MNQQVDDYDDHPKRRVRRLVLVVILVLAILFMGPVTLVVLFIVAFGFSNM
jgi:hypothetical protein